MKSLMSSESMDFSIGQDFFVAFLLTLFLTGVFAFPGFAFPTSSCMPDGYYRLKNPQYVKQLYVILGVKYFKQILLIAFWGRNKKKLQYFDGTRSGLNNLIYQSKQSEFGHFGALMAILIATCILLFHGYYLLSAIVTLINVLGNLYPIVLQRHHRMRIERLSSYATD